MTKLEKSPVEFNQEQHTYKLGDLFLQGVTSTLLKRVFPNKYAGISEDILQRAAERGTKIHEEIELFESIGAMPETEEGKNYAKLAKDAWHLNCIATEYTVSDLAHYASNIDAIYEVEDNVVDLADFKTTSGFDADNVSWQLSIYAYFFNLMNPFIEVRSLYGIWLRGSKAELIEVKKRSKEEVMALINADLRDEPFEWSPAIPQYFLEKEWSIKYLSKHIKEMQESLDTLKAELLQEMIEHKDKSIDTGGLLVTVLQSQKRTTFDSKKFKEEHADMYEKYIKETTTKESLKITVR